MYFPEHELCRFASLFSKLFIHTAICTANNIYIYRTPYNLSYVYFIRTPMRVILYILAVGWF